MDIYNLKGKLVRTEEKIKKSSISERNKKIIFDYERQLFLKERSIARIERCISVLRIVSENLHKDLGSVEREDIETFLEWVQRKDIADWTKVTYKRIFKTFLKSTGKNDLANLILIKRVRDKIPDIFEREEILKMMVVTNSSV